MEKIVISLLILMYSVTVNGQRIENSLQITKDSYLQKSNSQKTWATVLTIGGGVAVIGGVVMIGSNQSYVPNKEIGTALIIGGSAALVGGIMLFSAASRNKDKSNETDMLFKMHLENVTMTQNVAIKKNIILPLPLI
jgi:uncharacterized membrane protein